jgi:hypothetical protein
MQGINYLGAMPHRMMACWLLMNSAIGWTDALIGTGPDCQDAVPDLLAVACLHEWWFWVRGRWRLRLCACLRSAWVCGFRAWLPPPRLFVWRLAMLAYTVYTKGWGPCIHGFGPPPSMGPRRSHLRHLSRAGTAHTQRVITHYHP